MHRAQGRRRVLVVDPYVRGCDTLCACVVELGHEAVAVYSVKRAAQLARSRAVDLVITGHDPPWIDGWALVARLREQLLVPAIVLGGADADRALAATSVLRRPFSVNDLEGAIAHLAPDRASR